MMTFVMLLLVSTAATQYYDWFKDNVALCRKIAPYEQYDAYAALGGIVRHHLDPQGTFDRWISESVALPRHAAIEKDESSLRGRLGKPISVPSDLKVE